MSTNDPGDSDATTVCSTNLGVLLNTVSAAVGLGWGLRFCISNEL